MTYRDFFAFPVYKTLGKGLEAFDAEKKLHIYLGQAVSESEEQLLSKILQSLGLSLADDCQCFVLEQAQGLQAYWQEQRAFRLLCFGLDAQSLGLQSKTLYYRVTRFRSLDILFSHSLSSLSSDVQKKKLLWDALQIFFSREPL